MFVYIVSVMEECGCDEDMAVEVEECFQPSFRAWVSYSSLESGRENGRWLDIPKPLL